MNKHIKKLLGLTMTAAMGLSLVACGGSKDGGSSKGGESGSEGKELNIQCWNEEFITRVKDNYPGYEEVDATTGKIGDVTVNWTITPNQGSAYQDQLDRVLPGNADADAKDKVDMFLVEADYALKYIDAEADVAMKLSDLGIDTDKDLAHQYQYTKDIVTDANGDQRGSSWQICPAGMIYNREAAKEILGSDDPETVQAAVKDWDTFNKTAEEAKAKGWKMTSSYCDTYRVYSNNVSSKWVEDGKINLDDNIKKWVDDTKKLVDGEETGTFGQWGNDWYRGMYPAGVKSAEDFQAEGAKEDDPKISIEGEKVFCYFGPAWFFNFSMHVDDPASIASQGGWGFCEGPQSFFWGGSWVCAATGTDNPTLVKDIILKITADDDIMMDIAKKYDESPNNTTVIDALAADTSYSAKVLGGENPYPAFKSGVEKIDMSNLTTYDQACTEEMQNAMKNYFEGNASYDDAYALFEKAVKEKHPDLNK